MEMVVDVHIGRCICYRDYDVSVDEIFIESIKSAGVISPVIGRPVGSKFEVFIGRRRFKAAKELRFESIPIIIRDLSQEEMDILVIESNINQRGANAFKHSELAELVHDYHSHIKAQGRRSDLLKEVRCLINELEDDYSTSGPPGEKLDSCKESGAVFRMSARNISRYLRIYELTPNMKHVLDNNQVSVRACVEISFLGKELQDYVAYLIRMHNRTITEEEARVLRIKERDGSMDISCLSSNLSRGANSFKARTGFKSMQRIFNKYNLSAYQEKEIECIIDSALHLYFTKKQKIPLKK